MSIHNQPNHSKYLKILLSIIDELENIEYILIVLLWSGDDEIKNILDALWYQT